MVKESILFVASTALLIYFVTPTEEPPETAVAVEEPTPVADTVQDVDNSWGYDEAESEDETFVFGEPLIHSDDDYNVDATDTDEEESAGRAQPAETQSKRQPATRTRRPVSSSSPGPNERGGVNNPIIFEARTPENPVDD